MRAQYKKYPFTCWNHSFSTADACAELSTVSYCTFSLNFEGSESVHQYQCISISQYQYPVSATYYHLITCFYLLSILLSSTFQFQSSIFYRSTCTCLLLYYKSFSIFVMICALLYSYNSRICQNMMLQIFILTVQRRLALARISITQNDLIIILL